MRARRRRSIRLANHDYASTGAYFLTICAAHRACLFGSVRNQEVVLSDLGIVTKNLLRQVPFHVGDVDLDAFVVMPNHVHAIVMMPGDGRGTACRAPTVHTPEAFSRPRKGSLATIVRSYKSAVTREARRSFGILEVWQRGFHEHVIRGDTQLARIRQYIELNPARWAIDAYFAAEEAA